MKQTDDLISSSALSTMEVILRKKRKTRRRHELIRITTEDEDTEKL